VKDNEVSQARRNIRSMDLAPAADTASEIPFPIQPLAFTENNSAGEPLRGDLGALRQRAASRTQLVGGKGSIFYRAHSYHTKVPPEGIASLLEHFTDKGEVVLDPFCGSGMTGIAALLTGRRGVLSDLSPAAVHITSNYVRKVDPSEFAHAARALLRSVADLEEDLYALPCRECGEAAVSEYIVWSDVLRCPNCAAEIVFWKAAVDPEGAVQSAFDCPSCGQSTDKRSTSWIRSEPVLASTACRKCRMRTSGPVTAEERDRELGRRRADIRSWYPTTTFDASREMWRGQHRNQRVECAADFFTVRNLHALAEIWSSIGSTGDKYIREALRFSFTSIVNRASRRYQWNPKRPTNVLSSTMYIASLSYEFNVFSLLRRKIATMSQLYAATLHLPGRAEVHQGSAHDLSWLPSSSVSYVFTDPPFGSNIFYGDSSFLWEAWLGDFTDSRYEAVVNRSVNRVVDGKSLDDYERLLATAFGEVGRVLRPGGWASVAFHNSDDAVWSALQRALDSAGFAVEAAVAFDKSQPSFKGIKGLAGEKVPNFDLVLHLKAVTSTRRKKPPAEDAKALLARRLREHLVGAPPRLRTTPYLHSFAMRILLEQGLSPDGFSYEAIEQLCGELFLREGDGWIAAPDDLRAPHD